MHPTLLSTTRHSMTTCRLQSRSAGHYYSSKAVRCMSWASRPLSFAGMSRRQGYKTVVHGRYRGVCLRKAHRAWGNYKLGTVSGYSSPRFRCAIRPSYTSEPGEEFGQVGSICESGANQQHMGHNIPCHRTGVRTV